MPASRSYSGLKAEFVARPRHVVHAVRRIRHAEEVQPGADLDVGVRDVLAQDALEVPQRRADAGADVVDAALRVVGKSGQVDAERGVLVVDEVVLLVAALGEVERQAGGGRLDDLAGDAHLAVARGLARPVGGGEAQHHGVDAHVAVVVDAQVLAHQLGRIVDALRILRHVLGHRLVGRRAVLAEHRAVDAFRAGIDHALDVERARRFQHVHRAHDVHLHAERGVALRHRADERRRMDDVGHLVRLDDGEQARHVGDVAELDVHLVDDVVDQAVVAVARIDHRPMPLLDELAAGLGAHDAHAAGDQDFHGFRPLGRRRWFNRTWRRPP